jgi:hypothetical protein
MSSSNDPVAIRAAAEKKSKSGGGFFGMIFGGGGNNEQAQEDAVALYKQAGNLFKLQKVCFLFLFCFSSPLNLLVSVFMLHRIVLVKHRIVLNKLIAWQKLDIVIVKYQWQQLRNIMMKL